MLVQVNRFFMLIDRFFHLMVSNVHTYKEERRIAIITYSFTNVREIENEIEKSKYV